MNMHLVHTSIQTGANINPLKPSLLSAGRSMSYAEMINAVDTIAEVLIVEGIRKGDAVMVQLRDQAQMLVSLYAVMRAGAVAIPVPGELDSDAVAAIARPLFARSADHRALRSPRPHHPCGPAPLPFYARRCDSGNTASECRRNNSCIPRIFISRVR